MNADPKKVRSILKSLRAIAERMDDEGLVLFSGGCNDDAVLLERATGENVGNVLGYGVFMGGDYNETTIAGKTYNRDISPEADAYVRVLKAHS